MRANTILITILSLLLTTTAAFAQPAATTATPAATPATSPAVPAAAASNPAPSASTAIPGNNSTQQIETTVHQYLMKKPEVVVEALQAYQQKQMESMQQLFKDTQKLAPKYVDNLFHQNTDPVGGNLKGKITLVEFSDYQCSHCIETSAVVDAVIKKDPNVRVIAKEFPIRGPVSETAARAALAANKQGKYWEFRDILFKNGSSLSQDKIMELAKAIGLNIDQLKKDMDDATIRQIVKSNQQLAQNLKLVGTPAFFIAKSDIKTDAPSTDINYIPGMLTEQQLQVILDGLNKK